MSGTIEAVKAQLARLPLPDGGDLISRDMIRALTVDGGAVRFVIEAPNPETARQMEPLRQAAERAVSSLPGIRSVSAGSFATT